MTCILITFAKKAANPHLCAATDNIPKEAGIPGELERQIIKQLLGSAKKYG